LIEHFDWGSGPGASRTAGHGHPVAARFSSGIMPAKASDGTRVLNI